MYDDWMGLLEFLIANITSILSVIAIVVSLITLYLTYLRKGKLIFIRPNYIGAFINANPNGHNNDFLIIPITVINTGVKTRTLRLCIIANEKTEFRNSYDYDVMQIDDQKLKRKGHLFAATPILLEPLSANLKISCFLNLNYLASQKKMPTFDLWFNESENWEFAYRLTWSGFLAKRKDYLKGRLVISEKAFQLSREKPTYDSSILGE